jgi:hypothetical protein
MCYIVIKICNNLEDVFVVLNVIHENGREGQNM